MSFKKICIILLIACSLSACDKKKAEPAPADATKEAKKAEEKKEESPSNDTDDDPFPAPYEAVDVVAIVNGDSIPAKQFNDQVLPLARVALQIPPEQLDNIKNEIVNKLIDDQLIRQRLGEERLKKVSEKDLNEEKQKFKDQFPSEEAFKATLESMKMSEETLNDQMKIAVALKQLLQEEYDAKVSDDEVKKFYEDNKAAHFTRKEQVHARHILLNLKPDAPDAEVEKVKAKAKEIEKKAKEKGADFAKLAGEYSEGPTKSTGGDLGFFEAERMVPPFSKAAFALKPGEVSEPVRTQFGYHIIKVEEKKPAGVDSFDDVKDQIRERLEIQKLGTQIQKLLTELRSKATIERKDGDNVKANPKFEKAREEAMKNMPTGLPPGLQLGAPGDTNDLQLQLNNTK